MRRGRSPRVSYGMLDSAGVEDDIDHKDRVPGIPDPPISLQ